MITSESIDLMRVKTVLCGLVLHSCGIMRATDRHIVVRKVVLQVCYNVLCTIFLHEQATLELYEILLHRVNMHMYVFSWPAYFWSQTE